MMIQSAYIHIPFCKQICYYCDFNKFFLKGQPVDRYLKALKEEMRMTLEAFPTRELKTIYVGGGTPTALEAWQLEALCKIIRERLPFEKGEFTFEANPDDVTKEKLDILQHYGVNRLSLGVQSFDDEQLKRIGRTHTGKDVVRTVDMAFKAGFENISIDLMYALPGQKKEDFQLSLEKALQLDLPHYSAYSLIIEPKTVFYNLMKKGQLPLPSEDLEAEMYDLLINEMERRGIHQYEISNFAKKGFESKHNLVYWNNREYYGFGAGAHSYLDGRRRANYGPLKKYMEPLENGRFPVMEEIRLSKEEMMEEEMFLGLRKTEGVSLSRFNHKFGVDLMEIFSSSAEEMEKKGLLEVRGDFIRLTKKGRFLGNVVFQAFLGIS
jgi:oxygen-independent coproporphyrinogen-3 oxidase